MLRGVSPEQRPRVLYLQPETMTQPRLIAEWWIPAAGGISVTDDKRKTETRTFTMEQVLLWNPDILLLASPEGLERVRKDPAFAGLKAVKAGQVFGNIESVKAVSELYAPVSGEVVEVNSALKEKPEAVNTDPHSSWMVVIKLSNPSELGELLDMGYDLFFSLPSVLSRTTEPA